MSNKYSSTNDRIDYLYTTPVFDGCDLLFALAILLLVLVCIAGMFDE